MSVFKPQLTGNEVLSTLTKRLKTKQTFPTVARTAESKSCRCDTILTVYSKEHEIQHAARQTFLFLLLSSLTTMKGTFIRIANEICK